MKTFKKVAAQGDVLFIRLDTPLPANAIRVEPVNGKVVVAHSETGHHHVMEADGATMYRLPDSLMDCLLVIDKPTALEHLREFDTHEPIQFEPGIYHVRRQREHTPEGFRRVED